jgi:hypothetical protein
MISPVLSIKLPRQKVNILSGYDTYADRILYICWQDIGKKTGEVEKCISIDWEIEQDSSR